MDVRDVVTSLMITCEGESPVYNRLRKLANDKWAVDEMALDVDGTYKVIIEGKTQHSSIETAFIALMATPYWR